MFVKCFKEKSMMEVLWGFHSEIASSFYIVACVEGDNPFFLIIEAIRHSDPKW